MKDETWKGLIWSHTLYLHIQVCMVINVDLLHVDVLQMFALTPVIIVRLPNFHPMDHLCNVHKFEIHTRLCPAWIKIVSGHQPTLKSVMVELPTW